MLSHILKLDSLLCREADIFEATLNWVKSASNEEKLTGELIRTKCGDSFYDIHFGAMPLAKLTAFHEAYEGLFTPEEYTEILKMIPSKDVQPTIFHGNRRKSFEIERDDETAVHCRRLFWDKPVSPYYVKSVDTTTFSSNKSLWLGAIVCQILLVYHGKDEFDEDKYEDYKEDVPTEITIIEAPLDRLDDREVVFRGNAFLEANRDRDHTKITLPKPIPIRTGYLYEIEMKQSLPDRICTHYPLLHEVEIEPGTRITFRNVTFEDDDRLTRGLIPGLWISKI